MMSKKKPNRFQIENSTLDNLVPKEHLVRKIDNAIDFSFIYDEVSDLYSDIGAPSVDPVVLIKIVMIQYLFGIPSMRQTIKEIEVNVAYRWFIGYSFSEKIPHFSTFSKNYVRKFRYSDVFSNIFSKILEEAMNLGYVNTTEVFVDSTHIKAAANKKKYDKVTVNVEAKKYQEELEEEINKDRSNHGKKSLKKSNTVKTKEIVKSKTDPESGMFFKDEKEKNFAYKAHTACDNNNFVLDFFVSAGNVHDSVGFIDLYSNLKERFSDTITTMALDAGYVTPHICKTLFSNNILPAMPYKRPMTKKGFFKKYEYVYDEENDCYICPNNKLLKYSTTDKDGYKLYKSKSYECKTCPLLKQCTHSKDYQKVVLRHVWEEYVEEANHLRHNEYIKQVYSRRKETIERVFADGKERHGMRYTRLKSLAKINMEVTLIFACMNLKKLANKKWMVELVPSSPFISRVVIPYYTKFRILRDYICKKEIFYNLENLFCLQSDINIY